MTGFSRSPPILKSGIVLLDPASFQPLRIVVLQYNPDQLSRTLQVQAMSGESGDRSEALRLKGAPVETFKLEAEIDATDQLEFPDQNISYKDLGIFPQLAALESLISPTSDQLSGMESILTGGTVEIAPVEAPLALFVWSVQRVAPVRVTEFSITEEAFDTQLNPIRAKVSLGLRVLTISDFGFGHKGGQYFMAYLKNKEFLAQKAGNGDLSKLGNVRLL
ncbi:hypothetical protein [Methylobacter marinus]|uniref:hypothetical protein n=1 Tax=Methylobacter marinus TaxID=34058 RepID=UPI00037C8F5C|nr:hypothetical protein [Methylobacter marinus]